MSRPHVVSSAELQSLRDLELTTRATVEGLRQGLHRSPFHGYSAEFSQYRHYQPGDDLKYVDWKAFARTDRLYTRQFRETTNLSALFVVDVSRSMDFPERSPTKLDLAKTVTAVLGTLVLDQGDAAGVLAVAGTTHYVPPRSGHYHLGVFLSEVARLDAGGTGVEDALRRAGTIMKRRGVVVAVSDFYEDDVALIELRRLARMGHDVIAIHTLAPDELSLRTADAAEFVDLESQLKLTVDPSAIRDSFEQSVARWLQGIEGATTRDGLDYLRLIVGAPLEPALRRFLISRRGGA